MSLGVTYTYPIARKPHRCAVCLKNIEAGETYTRCKGQWNGDWQNWGGHDICLEIHGHSEDDDDSIQTLCWIDLVQLTTSTDQLNRLLERFPMEPSTRFVQALQEQRDRLETQTNAQL